MILQSINFREHNIARRDATMRLTPSVYIQLGENGLREDLADGNDGTITGSLTAVRGVGGMAAYAFPGGASVANYITCTNSAAIQFGTDDFTVGAWVRRTGYRVRGGIVTSEDFGNGNRWCLMDGLNNNQIDLFIRDGTNQAASSVNYTWDSNWHLVMMRVQRGATDLMQTWVDGVQVGSSTSISSLTGSISSTQSMGIGNRIAFGDGFIGDIDEVIIFKRALSEDEMKFLTSLGRVRAKKAA